MVNVALSARTDGRSWAEWIAADPTRRARFDALSEEQAQALRYDWRFWARPNQLPPDGDWHVWVLQAGRGMGKSRTGAETIRAWIEAREAARIALVSDTAADVRDVMIEGPSGLLAVCPPLARPRYEPSKRRVTWPNGATAVAYAAEAPELLRGPQFDGAWCDELAKWANLQKRDPHGGTAWSNLLLGLRVGEHPRVVVTTTPRPATTYRYILAQPGTVLTRGTAYENRANLSPEWFSAIIRQYEGTRLGRQELHGELLTDTPGALWQVETIDATRVASVPALRRIVVAVDPPGSDAPEAAEAGIVAAGLGANGDGYVLHDLSGHATPAAWGARAVEHYRLLKADRIVGEVNYGGQMVEHTIRMAARDVGAAVAYKNVTASRGKTIRAEPIAALYEQGRVHHCGTFPALEDELTNWTPGLRSPSRLDALVWALTELMLGPENVALDILGGTSGWMPALSDDRNYADAYARMRAAYGLPEETR